MKRSCTTCKVKIETLVQGPLSISLNNREVYFCSYICIVTFDQKMVQEGKTDGIVYAKITRSAKSN